MRKPTGSRYGDHWVIRDRFTGDFMASTGNWTAEFSETETSVFADENSVRMVEIGYEQARGDFAVVIRPLASAIHAEVTL